MKVKSRIHCGVLLNLAQANVEVVYGGYGNDVLIGGGADNYFISGAAGDDLMRGGRGGDQLYSGEGNDVLDGGLGDDRINGEAGNDVVIASGGEDTVDGGAGTDLIELKGGLEDYSFVRNTDGSFTITDHKNEDGSVVAQGAVSDRNGIQHLSNVERFSFQRGQTPTAVDFAQAAPLPVDDRVVANAGGSTIIAASALLGNDLDFQGGALNVYWVGNAVGGAIRLRKNNLSTSNETTWRKAA